MSYQRITLEEWERLLQHPEEAHIPLGKSVSVLEFDAFEASPPSLADVRHLDLYKNWDGLHYLLTGWSVFSAENDFASPLSRVLTGGEETAIPCSYGFVRHLEPTEVRALADALQHLNEAELRGGFWRNLPQSREVYAFNGDEFELESTLAAFALVRDFFHHAAQSGDAILISSD